MVVVVMGQNQIIDISKFDLGPIQLLLEGVPFPIVASVDQYMSMTGFEQVAISNAQFQCLGDHVLTSTVYPESRAKRPT
jgi:hypothetical protein